MQDLNQWVKSLPLVLLGIRMNIKQDINCTSAELVYGTTLRLPSEFFQCSDQQLLDPIDVIYAATTGTSCEIKLAEVTLCE